MREFYQLQGKTIKAYPCDKVVQLKNMSTQNEDVCSMTFEQFNSASIKSKVHCIMIRAVTTDAVTTLLFLSPS